MKQPFRTILITFGFYLMATPVLADQAPYPQDETALQKEYQALQWQETVQDYALPGSNSHIRLPAGFSLLIGSDAERYVFLNNGVEFPDTEVVLYDNASKAEIDFDYVEEGFVKDDDWSEIDADDFLAQMKEGQIASNEERVANGQEAFEVIGWLEPPTYDAATHTAHYVLELGNTQRHWVNAIAVKLGRAGYHQVTWVGDVSLFKSNGPNVLKTALNSHTYDDGHRYADFKDGDDVAAYGLAGLVAAVAGVKLGKGLIAATIAFLALAGKKLAIVIIPAAIGIGALVKRFFRRG